MSSSTHTNFKQYLATAKPKGAEVPVGLQDLLSAVVNTCSTLSHEVAQGALIGLLGSAGTGNVQGEVQQKLDIIANDLLIDGVKGCKSLAGLASEEMELPVPVQGTGDYLLLFDPLDGSSNIDVNVSIGTIFSILKKQDPQAPLETADFLLSGRHQVAAGYVVYGPQTTMALTLGDGVVMFTLNKVTGEFLLIKDTVTISHSTKEFAINMSNMRHWADPVRRYVEECLAGVGGAREKDFNMRWIASMVADVHRVLSRGGVFMYPWDQREPHKPGKLRLMYEANPMSFLVEQAGGASTNGSELIMDLQPTDLHERVSVMLGSKEEIDRLRHYHS
ncbi:class 1 fructose-bisphosphatase [Polynucleobacter sp. AP-Titi-500A-B4]|uniref:class 1 fructose-bisphosphatase n=1 Tax=Polynucleobacter sp. AP-Titi-500A-B4 TaxID=2576923 RepID=UPI001BFD99A0|nr:class 1 fructose-bisphosphatase [Polynucleobacter sp. AP-Titi-500A-B4]QWE11842.1 class 1 fructose-bisphosphatase [Polynucleobacter sp. AP-Titi-500A-B4]